MNGSFSIIPGLVSLETNMAKIPDFLLSQNLNFYPFIRKESLHYKVFLVSQIAMPVRYDYKVGNYTIAGDTVTYDRPLFAGVGFRYSYNVKTKTLYFNYLYGFHTVNIGDIFTIGRHLFHIIEADLVAEGKVIVLGAAVAKGRRNCILLAANGGGKTSFVNLALDRNYSYISENYIVFDSKKTVIYGTCPILFNKGHMPNQQLAKRFSQRKILVRTRTPIRNAYLLFPSRNNSKRRICANYINTFSGYYKKNNLVRTLLYYKLRNMQQDETYSRFTKWLIPRIIVVRNLESIPL